MSHGVARPPRLRRDQPPASYGPAAWWLVQRVAMSQLPLRRLAVFVEAPDEGRFEWVLGELDADDRVQTIAHARRGVDSYQRAMAAGLLKLQQQVEDLDAGPREDTRPTRRTRTTAPRPRPARPRGTAFGFGPAFLSRSHHPSRGPTMATGTRTLWKGAITFGLVHIPVGLHTASTEQGVDFDWLDKRTMDPVGYKRINKRTGREIDRDNIVKGIAYEDGKYVIISPAGDRGGLSAHHADHRDRALHRRQRHSLRLPRAALLRGADQQGPEGLCALARGAREDRQGRAREGGDLDQAAPAVLVPSGKALVLNLMRWGDEVKTLEGLELPPEGVKSARITPAEMKMAEQLVKDMSGAWNPRTSRTSSSTR